MVANHTDSKAELDEGEFCGLALDEDTQEEMTAERIVTWCDQIYNEFTTLEPALSSNQLEA
jgi:hypothetical protein